MHRHACIFRSSITTDNTRITWHTRSLHNKKTKKTTTPVFSRGKAQVIEIFLDTARYIRT